MTSTAEQLRSLFPPTVLAQLDAVRSCLLADPTALDNKVRKEVAAGVSADAIPS